MVPENERHQYWWNGMRVARAPGLMCPSVMAWAFNHLPSPRFMGLVLSCACLPTNAMTPDNANVASLIPPRLSLSPNYLYP